MYSLGTPLSLIQEEERTAKIPFSRSPNPFPIERQELPNPRHLFLPGPVPVNQVGGKSPEPGPGSALLSCGFTLVLVPVFLSPLTA